MARAHDRPAAAAAPADDARVAGAGSPDVERVEGRWYSVVYRDGGGAAGFSRGKLIRADHAGGELAFHVPGEPSPRRIVAGDIISLLSARHASTPPGAKPDGR